MFDKTSLLVSSLVLACASCIGAPPAQTGNGAPDAADSDGLDGTTSDMSATNSASNVQNDANTGSSDAGGDRDDGTPTDLPEGADASVDMRRSVDLGGECAPACQGGTECIDGTCQCPPNSLCACPSDEPAPGSATCPDECTGGCDTATNTCLIECGELECEGDSNVITCPPDYACLLRCIGTESCDGSDVECPPGHACDIVCQGSEACDDVTVFCGSGSCAVSCEPDACPNTLVQCGAGACVATCDDNVVETDRPDLQNSAESCTAIGC